MKRQKKLFIVMLIAVMLLTIGCSSNNEANNETNVVENNVSETENTESATLADELELDYSSKLDENGFFEGVKATDFVELTTYKDIMIPTVVHTITEEAIQSTITSLLSEHATSAEVTDRAVENLDTVNIDYVGSVDGVEFDGGSTGGNGTEVTIGVTGYIDDFLEQIIGHMPGESFDIEVTFPDDYGVDTLNGKDAVFSITVNYISETIMPELTDTFVTAYLSEKYEANTVDELKVLIQAELQQTALIGYLQEYIMSNSTVTSLPDIVMDFQEDVMVNYYKMSAFSYGMQLEEFLAAYVGYDSLDALKEAYEPQLTMTSQYSLVVQAIAEEANIIVDEEDLAAYFTKFTDSADYQQYEDNYGLPYLKNLILQDVILEYLIDNSILEN